MNCARCCNPSCGRAGGPWTPGECNKFQDVFAECARLRAQEKLAEEKVEPRAPTRCELPHPVVAKDRREFEKRHGEVK